ncbi:MAG: tetratricopeptide repeat protein [Myxococcota bacterium]
MLVALSLLAHGAEPGRHPGLDERTNAALDKLKVKVDGAWSDGHHVVVDLTVAKFDRMLDTLELSLDGELGGVETECLTKEGAYEYCWRDEGKRRVRVRFESLQPVGTHTLHWYGQTVAKLEVKPGGGAPAMPAIDYTLVDEMDFRLPESFVITGVSEYVDPEDLRVAPPGTRYLVVEAEMKGTPASLLGSSLQLGGDDEPSPIPMAALECTVGGETLGTCDPTPEHGTWRAVFEVPEGRASGQIEFGDGLLGEAFELGELDPVDLPDTLTEGLPELPPADPVVPLRAWRSPDGAWVIADLELTEPTDFGGYRPDLTLHDPEYGYPMAGLAELEAYAVDPSDGTAAPVPFDQARFLRVSWSVYEMVDRVLFASNGRLVGELEVAPTGPSFSELHAGRLWMDSGDFATALVHLEKAYLQDPANGEVVVRLAETHAALEQHEAALEWALRGIEQGLTNAQLWWVAGHSARRLGRLAEAKDLLQQGIAQHAEAPSLRIELARAHRDEGDLVGAERWLLRASRGPAAYQGEACSELAATMEAQAEKSLSTMALFWARLDTMSPTRDADAVALRAALTQPTVWAGGNALRGPLASVAPRRVQSTDVQVAAAQLELLILSWAQAVETGWKSEQHRNDPWYSEKGGLFVRIVEADLVEAAAWTALVYPGEEPARLRARRWDVLDLAARYNAGPVR